MPCPVPYLRGIATRQGRGGPGEQAPPRTSPSTRRMSRASEECWRGSRRPAPRAGTAASAPCVPAGQGPHPRRAHRCGRHALWVSHRTRPHRHRLVATGHAGDGSRASLHAGHPDHLQLGKVQPRLRLQLHAAAAGKRRQGEVRVVSCRAPLTGPPPQRDAPHVSAHRVRRQAPLVHATVLLEPRCVQGLHAGGLQRRRALRPPAEATHGDEDPARKQSPREVVPLAPNLSRRLVRAVPQLRGHRRGGRVASGATARGRAQRAQAQRTLMTCTWQRRPRSTSHHGATSRSECAQWYALTPLRSPFTARVAGVRGSICVDMEARRPRARLNGYRCKQVTWRGNRMSRTATGCPAQPLRLVPHVNRDPSVVRAALWSDPAATKATRYGCSASTRLNVNCVVPMATPVPAANTSPPR